MTWNTGIWRGFGRMSDLTDTMHNRFVALQTLRLIAQKLTVVESNCRFANRCGPCNLEAAK